MIEAVFLLSAAAVAYVYFGYPALLALRARLRPRPVHRAPIRPRLSVIIAAYDEEEVIEGKIRDTLANGYPPDRLEILVASDGSTDRTVERARRHAGDRVRILDLPRQGKLGALNEAVGHARHPILVFTDADVALDPGSLEKLVEPLADPDVGGVTGRKAPAAQAAADAAGVVGGGEGLYARYDEWQKRLEADAGSAVASHGALHAVRRELYVPPRDLTVADDQAISARVVLQGRRLAYARDAVARVESPRESAGELRRKVRIANQVLRALFDLGPALWSSGFYSVQLVSHKLLRYMVPLFLLLMLVTNMMLALAPAPLWRSLLVAQLAFYGLAATGRLLRRHTVRPPRVLNVPYYFCLVNAAALLALVSFLRGQRASGWTPRSGFHTTER